MNTKARRKRQRIYLYALLIVLCLIGVTLGVATTSFSSVQKIGFAGNQASDGKREAELLYRNHGARGTGDELGRIALAAPYQNDNSAPPNGAKPLFFLFPNQTAATKIAPQVMVETAGGQTTSIVILLANQADVSAAYDIKDQDARGWFVYHTLTQHAARTQAGLQALLQTRGIPYQSFWAANMVVATADGSLIELLAARSDVTRIDSNTPARWIEDPAIGKFSPAASSAETVEWGVQNVNAPAVWAIGDTGTGIVVGDLDTGVRWTHSALKPKYRGWNGATADHNYNWHDAIHSGGGVCGANTVAPCDDSGHGTHTAGIMVGDDGAGNQVGVAPGAKWIGCRNMDRGNGTPAAYTECFQFAIAPTDLTGNNPNPTLRPHVLNNSWSCPPSEGCTTGAELETIVNNTQAAGIFVEVSAGNSGPNCSSVSTPAAIYSASFSTGAIDISNTLANFSSRGPSTYYSPALLKPNISAPGVGVRSSYGTGDTTFATLSGTSMAGPHVVGAVALLWSAHPQLARDIAATKSILQSTANPTVNVAPAETCGGTSSSQIPNNSFGYGRVDALAAVNASLTVASAGISGHIFDAGGQPLSGATINLSGERPIRTITDANGFYQVENLNADSFYMVTPARANYVFTPANRAFSLLADKTDAAFTATPVGPNANPLDTPEFFVRQQYLDFLAREPDQGGFAYWSDQINQCNSDAVCIRARRIDVSADFFISQEFQQSGTFIYDIYTGSLGRRPLFTEYSADRVQVVGGASLEAEKDAFAQSFVQRAEFVAKYPTAMNAEIFVDALLQSVRSLGVDLSSERANLISAYNNGPNQVTSRAAVVRAVADNATFAQSQYNSAFVLAEYFGYLRRDADPDGYNFWVNVLSHGDPGNYRGMVCSFITSAEYQQRFSPVVTHTNAECGPG